MSTRLTGFVLTGVAGVVRSGSAVEGRRVVPPDRLSKFSRAGGGQSHSRALLLIPSREETTLCWAITRKRPRLSRRLWRSNRGNSEYAHWLGRSFGRRAETASPFLAARYASKARAYFEKAVALDPNSEEALRDLFDYYLEAPGFLGGGYDKAEAIAQRIAARNPAEGQFVQARLADQRKQFDTAEEQLRRAIELAPRQVGRLLDLARYLARHGRIQESEAAFDKAEQLAPNSPEVYFARAGMYVEQKRNLDRAKALLIKYLGSELTADDPPREQAEKLLREASGA